MIKPLGPGAAVIREALTKSFSNVETELRAQLKKIYRAYVDRMFNEFMATAMDPGSSGRIREGYRRHSAFSDWNQWTSIDPDEQRKAGLIPGTSVDTWDEIKKRPEMIKKTYVMIDREAATAYETARDSFIEKNLQKITHVLGARSDVQVVLADFAFNRGVFAGKVYVSLKNGDELTAHVSLKYVVRYIPRVTPYYQYPLLFYKAIIGKKTLSSPSEEELRLAFGGASAEKYGEQQAQAALAEGWCPMSGQFAPEGSRKQGRYRNCTKCGSLVSLSAWGKFLKHKTQAAVKQAEEQKLADAGYCPMSKQPAPHHMIEKSIKPYTVYPGGVERIQYEVDLYAPGGKSKKLPCEKCGQLVVVGDTRAGYTPAEVRAYYQKHKIKK